MRTLSWENVFCLLFARCPSTLRRLVFLLMPSSATSVQVFRPGHPKWGRGLGLLSILCICVIAPPLWWTGLPLYPDILWRVSIIVIVICGLSVTKYYVEVPKRIEVSPHVVTVHRRFRDPIDFPRQEIRNVSYREKTQTIRLFTSETGRWFPQLSIYTSGLNRADRQALIEILDPSPPTSS